MPVAIDSFGLTDKGKVRKGNEDNFLIVDIHRSVDISHSSLSSDVLANRFGSADAHLFVVADGVGGGPAGEQASEEAIAALLKYVSETVGCFNRLEPSREHELFERLEETVRGVDQNLREEHSGKHGPAPATTLTMVLLIWPRAYLIHVGDSRAYVRRRGRLQQLTRDQTLGEYMVSLGAWTEEQAARSRPAAALSSAIGGSELHPVVGLVDLEPGDSIILSTDGLTKHVSIERIEAQMERASDVEGVARQLVDDALDAGGSDNVTVIVVSARK
jgi:serine/threonine protein phosphatase PrpC